MEILVKRLNDNAKMPAYSHEAGPGINLYALEGVTVQPGQKALVKTGIAMAMPVGYVGNVWSQDSMVVNEELKVTHSMIDSGYRDEVVVEVFNSGQTDRTIEAGEAVACVLVQEVNLAHLIEAEDLSGSD
jgi:dUTP pyrophosphatase